MKEEAASDGNCATEEGSSGVRAERSKFPDLTPMCLAPLGSRCAILAVVGGVSDVTFYLSIE